MRRYLAAIERDPELETPKPGDSAFWEVEKRVVANHRAALAAAAKRASDYGFRAQVLSASLTGEAAIVGRRIAGSLFGQRDTAGRGGACLIWGGETTVSMSGTVHGAGGRCQELLLAAAEELAQIKPVFPGSLLAAGTDGRDGVTDAAGAIVDASTWSAIRTAGRDPAEDLRAHDSYSALDSVGALIKTGDTGTNVMDIVVGLVL
jgi:glycerate-2-kinase